MANNCTLPLTDPERARHGATVAMAAYVRAAFCCHVCQGRMWKKTKDTASGGGRERERKRGRGAAMTVLERIGRKEGREIKRKGGVTKTPFRSLAYLGQGWISRVAKVFGQSRSPPFPR